jgi:hypothetical protein
VLREENTPTSLPVVTIGDADRVLNDLVYRDLCVNRLLEIVLYIENHTGTRRIFIPLVTLITGYAMSAGNAIAP